MIIELLMAAATAIPAFDADISATSKNCTFADYANHSTHVFSVEDGHSLVTFRHHPCPGDPKGWDTMWTVATKPFAVTGGYEGFVKVSLSGNVGTGRRPGAVISWLKADGSSILYQDPLGKMSPLKTTINLPWPREDRGETTVWTRCQVPPEAKRAKMEIKVDNPDIKGGEHVSVRQFAYFEHVRGEAYELDDLEPPQLVVLNESPSADLMAPIRFRITDKSGVDIARTKINLDGKDLSLASLPREGETFVYRPAAPWRENSLHELKLDAIDVRGNRGTDSGFVAFSHSELKHPKCTVRDDGMMLMDGQPFFPFGWCRMRPCAGNGFDMERGIREMMNNGMNAGHTYMADRDGPAVSALLKEQIESCQRNRLLLYVEPTERQVRRPRFVPLAEKEMFKYRSFDYPVLWGIGDDTSVTSDPEAIRRYYSLCKAIDPYILTVSADVGGSAGMYEAFVPSIDVLAIEIYPIRTEPTAKDMAIVARSMDNGWTAVQTVGRKDRTVMALPQCFKGWGSWKRYPTMEEIKCQAYLTVACRVRGIFFYASTGQKFNQRTPAPGKEIAYSALCPLDRPDLKEEFFAFAREFSALLPSLVKRDAAQQPVVRITKGPKTNVLETPSVRCLLKEDGLLVAANTSAETVEAEITLPSGRKLHHTFPRYGYWVHK